MYRWIWDHLPGPAAVRAVIFAAAAAGIVVLVVAVVSPALRPSSPGSADDGTPVELSDIVEPDGVRSSPRPVVPAPEPTPVVPEDNLVPQQ